jgi:hypothetical protein
MRRNELGGVWPGKKQVRKSGREKWHNMLQGDENKSRNFAATTRLGGEEKRQMGQNFPSRYLFYGAKAFNHVIIAR